MKNITFPITDSDFVRGLIPQKSPFVMVDSLISFSDKYITAALTIEKENILSKDGILTSAGLIEHMAQTVALYTGFQYYLNDQQPPTGYIGSIKTVDIKDLPKSGQTVQTTAEILQEFMGVTLLNMKCYLEGIEIANAQMKTVIAK